MPVYFSTGFLAADASILAAPTADGTNGQVLTTNGNGQLVFEDAASGGGSISQSALATPSFAVDGDADTGITQETSNPDTLSVVAGGVEAMRVEESGGDVDVACENSYLLVGTSSRYGGGLDAKLHVAGSAVVGSVVGTGSRGSNANTAYRFANDLDSGLYFPGGGFGLSASGSKIIESTGNNIGFLGATPVAQQAHIPDVPTGGSANAADNAAAINSIIAVLEAYGLTATS